jgi:hypothetical protein
VVALVLLLKVVGPVVVEVAVGVQGAELEDGFRGAGGPSGTGDGHAVFDQVAAGAFDQAAGDGPAVRQRGGVVQPEGFAVQVAGAQGGGDVGGAAVQDGRGAVPDPRPGVRAGLGEKAPGRVPQVLGDVPEIHDDGDGDATLRGAGADPADLVLVPVR